MASDAKTGSYPDQPKLPHILVVDDEEDIRDLLKHEITRSICRCSLAADGIEALKILESQPVDVVITDINMPRLDGLQLTKQIKSRFESEVIIMTGYVKHYTYENIIEIGASDFVRKPVSPRELMVRLKRVLRERRLLIERNLAYEKLQKSYEQLRTTLDQTVNALTYAVEIRDPYTSGHQRRATKLSCAIAEHMRFPDDRIEGIRICGLLHDIGKISIPSGILNKPGKLQDAEFSLLKRHPITGYEILRGIEFPWPVAEIVLQHHERMDGSGYPNGLKGDEIFLEAKILSVADVVEAMSSHRPYRPALGIEKALEEISRNRGRWYDEEIVDHCLALFSEKGFSLKD